MRLKELQQAEKDYLIVNGWHSTKVRGEPRWRHSKHFPATHMTQDEAVALQKQRDAGHVMVHAPVHIHDDGRSDWIAMHQTLEALATKHDLHFVSSHRNGFRGLDVLVCTGPHHYATIKVSTQKGESRQEIDVFLCEQVAEQMAYLKHKASGMPRCPQCATSMRAGERDEPFIFACPKCGHSVQ